jgi:hypothetical protein
MRLWNKVLTALLEVSVLLPWRSCGAARVPSAAALTATSLLSAAATAAAAVGVSAPSPSAASPADALQTQSRVSHAQFIPPPDRSAAAETRRLQMHIISFQQSPGEEQGQRVASISGTNNATVLTLLLLLLSLLLQATLTAWLSLLAPAAQQQ